MGNVPKIAGKVLGKYRENKRNVPGKLLEIKEQYRESIRKVPGNYKKKYRESTKNVPGKNLESIGKVLGK